MEGCHLFFENSKAKKVRLASGLPSEPVHTVDTSKNQQLKNWPSFGFATIYSPGNDCPFLSFCFVATVIA
jgi:hypothetical protein